jgi:hypothetical protein
MSNSEITCMNDARISAVALGTDVDHHKIKKLFFITHTDLFIRPWFVLCSTMYLCEWEHFK